MLMKMIMMMMTMMIMTENVEYDGFTLWWYNSYPLWQKQQLTLPPASFQPVHLLKITESLYFGHTSSNNTASFPTATASSIPASCAARAWPGA